MTASHKPIKQKKCRNCPTMFSPYSSMTKACSVPCAIALVESDKATKINKEFNRETKRLKQKIKTRGEWIREAQSIFNRFIRERDIADPCISCRRHHSGQYHAGHYKTVGGNPELRFDERNCHKQCSACNNHLSGNIPNYRINLVNKIGLAGVEEVEGPHEPLKLTIEDIKSIKEKYNRKYRELIKDQE